MSKLKLIKLPIFSGDHRFDEHSMALAFDIDPEVKMKLKVDVLELFGILIIRECKFYTLIKLGKAFDQTPGFDELERLNLILFNRKFSLGKISA